MISREYSNIYFNFQILYVFFKKIIKIRFYGGKVGDLDG